MSVVCTWMRKIFAILVIILSAYLAAVQFILPEGSIENIIGFESISKKFSAEEITEPVTVVSEASSTPIIAEVAADVAQPAKEPESKIIIAGLPASACMLGTLHRELVNGFLRGDDYSDALTKLQQLNNLPIHIIEWFALLEEYQSLIPEEQEVLSLDKGVWGWFFAKTLRITMVNEHTLRSTELRANILDGLPEFNDFVFNGVYPKGCANVYN